MQSCVVVGNRLHLSEIHNSAICWSSRDFDLRVFRPSFHSFVAPFLAMWATEKRLIFLPSSQFYLKRGSCCDSSICRRDVKFKESSTTQMACQRFELSAFLFLFLNFA